MAIAAGLAVDYRLPPANPWPAPDDDAYAEMAAIFDQHLGR